MTIIRNDSSIFAMQALDGTMSLCVDNDILDLLVSSTFPDPEDDEVEITTQSSVQLSRDQGQVLVAALQRWLASGRIG